MAEKVLGTNAMIKFNVHGTLAFYCYAKSFQIDIATELVPVSTIGDGKWKKHKAKRHSYTVTMDALFLVADSNPLVSSPEFLEQQLQEIETPFEILYTGESGGILSMNGRVWIENMSFSVTPSGFVSKNVSMRGNGRLNRGITPISMVNLTMSVIASPGAVTMGNIIVTDGDGNETTVFAGTITNGGNQVVSIPTNTYHIRATLNTDRAYNLFSSDASPGFAVNLGGPLVNYIYWPYPPNSPIWDFTSNRILTWQGSDTPIS